jgi:hypothetical protein
MWEKCTLFDINIQPKKLTTAEVRKGFHQLSRVLYCNAFTHQRCMALQENWRKACMAQRLPPQA